MAKHAVVGRGTGGTDFQCDDMLEVVKVLKESHDTVVAMEALLTTCVSEESGDERIYRAQPPDCQSHSRFAGSECGFRV